MRTDVITAQTLPQLLPAWRALEQRADCAPLPAGMAAGPLSAEGACILTAWQADQLLAVWPLRVMRQGLLRLAVRFGRELQPYDGILLDRAAPPDTVTALWEALARSRRADILQLRAIPDDSPLRTSPAIAPHTVRSEETWWLRTDQLTDPAAVIQRLSKTRRKSVRRKRRALAQHGAVQLLRPDTPAQRIAAVRAALQLKGGWLQAQDLHSFAVGAGWFERGLIEAVAEPSLRDQVEVFVLTCAEAPVAYEIGFRDRQGYTSFLGAFSAEHASLGVGGTLTAAVMAWCVEMGVGRYDMLPPATDFKAGWCDTTAPVWSARIPLSRRGQLLEPMSDAARQLKPLYLKLPLPARKGLNALLRRLR